MNIVLRRAEEDDRKILWKWRNHPAIRKNFFDDKIVPWKKHCAWFDSKIKDSNTKIYMALLSGKKIGVIRFEKEDSAARVSLNLDPMYFGKGFGTKIMILGIQKLFDEEKDVQKVIGELKKDNVVSQKMLLNAGFNLFDKGEDGILFCEKAR